MASEIRVNQIQNRSGLSTVTFSDTGVVISGITTISDLRASGNTIVSAGSTSAPSISPTGDSNTGIFFPSPDTVAIAEGGVEALRIDSNGNIGLGTNNPTQRLDVRGQVFSVTSANSDQNLRYRSSDTNWHGTLNQSVSGGTIANTIGVGGRWDVSGTTYNCTKDFNGSFPSAALSIQNQYNSSNGARFAFLSKASGSTTTDGSVTELAVLNSSGNFGIGSNSPTNAKLEVVADSSTPAAHFYRQRNTTGGGLVAIYDDVSSTKNLKFNFISGGDLYCKQFLNTKNITTFSYTQDLYGSTTIDFNFDSTESTSHFVLLSSNFGCTGFAAVIMITQHFVGSEGTLDVYRNNARYGTVSYSLSAAGSGTALNNKLVVNCASLGWGCGGSKPSTGTVYLTILSSGAATSMPI